MDERGELAERFEAEGACLRAVACRMPGAFSGKVQHGFPENALK